MKTRVSAGKEKKAMIKELKLGFMSTEELIEWAGKPTIAKHKGEWCNKFLKNYADYELVRGGINITKIIEPVFASSTKKQVSELFDSCWGTKDLKADRCKYTSRRIYALMKNPEVQEDTVYNYTCREKRERYGVPKKYEGTLGSSRWIFAKNIHDRAVLFTPEEEQIKHDLMQKYLKTREDQVIEMRAAQASYLAHEITKEEYQSVVDAILEQDIGWDNFITAFETAIGAKVDFFTLLEPRAWENSKDDKESV